METEGLEKRYPDPKFPTRTGSTASFPSPQRVGTRSLPPLAHGSKCYWALLVLYFARFYKNTVKIHFQYTTLCISKHQSIQTGKVLKSILFQQNIGVTLASAYVC